MSDKPSADLAEPASAAVSAPAGGPAPVVALKSVPQAPPAPPIPLPEAVAPPAPAVLPVPAPALRQPLEKWVEEDVRSAKEAMDKRAEERVHIFVAVACTKAAGGWQPGQMMTRVEYNAGMERARRCS